MSERSALAVRQYLETWVGRGTAPGVRVQLERAAASLEEVCRLDVVLIHDLRIALEQALLRQAGREPDSPPRPSAVGE